MLFWIVAPRIGEKKLATRGRFFSEKKMCVYGYSTKTVHVSMRKLCRINNRSIPGNDDFYRISTRLKKTRQPPFQTIADEIFLALCILGILVEIMTIYSKPIILIFQVLPLEKKI